MTQTENRSDEELSADEAKKQAFLDWFDLFSPEEQQAFADALKEWLKSKDPRPYMEVIINEHS